MKKIDFILAGVGGQGTILASDILADVGLAAGYDAKKAEVHGMSQRGGAVESQVRWAEKVYSPLIEVGQADFLIGFEILEALRWTEYLNAGSQVIINDYRIHPLSVSAGKDKYPSDDEVKQILTSRTQNIWMLDGIGIAKQLGNPAMAGIVLLGALSTRLDVDEKIWLKVIEARVPARFVEANKKAFAAGRALAS